MNLVIVILNTIILAFAVTILGVSSAAINKINKENKQKTPNLIAYWYSILGISIVMVLISIFFLTGNSLVFIHRDTYLE